MPIFVFLLLILSKTTLAQEHKPFNRAIEKENFCKAERIFRRQVKKHKKATYYFNGEGSGMVATYRHSFDTLVHWLHIQPQVEDAFADRCQTKIAIYPGTTLIGARFKTGNGVSEKCFRLQEGTTGTVKLRGIHFQVFPFRKVLVYKGMSDCPGFVNEQKKVCKDAGY